MRSKEPKQKFFLRDLLDDPELQRRARAWAKRLVNRYKLAPMTGDDLYQEAVAKLLRYTDAEEPREISYPAAFIFRVLHNQALTLGKRQIEAAEYDEIPSQKLSDNFDMVQRIESGILLDEAFRSLDNEQDKVLFICITKGYTSRQIAVVFNVSHVTAADRVIELIKKIRKSLL